MSEPEPVFVEAPHRAGRMPLWLARLLARTLRRAGITTSVLLGLASVLTAFSAYQATEYSDQANQYTAIASRATVDSVNQAQEDYAQHLFDSQIWVAIIASGDSVEQSPLTPLLSQRWLDALERTSARGDTFADDGSYLFPLDSRYFEELTVKSRAYTIQTQQAYDIAQEKNAVSSRITGSSIMYSAALLLLTVATTTTRNTGKLVLNVASIVIIVAAIVIGWATPVFG